MRKIQEAAKIGVSYEIGFGVLFSLCLVVSCNDDLRCALIA